MNCVTLLYGYKEKFNEGDISLKGTKLRKPFFSDFKATKHIFKNV